MIKLLNYTLPIFFALTGYNICSDLFEFKRNEFKSRLTITNFEIIFYEIILKPIGYFSLTFSGFYLGKYINNKLFYSIQ